MSSPDDLPERGVYTLVIRLSHRTELYVGSLGRVELEAGFYLYTGSGLGRGPLSLRGRVLRHLGRRRRLFWHIDYLLSRPESSVEAVVAAEAEERLECLVNRALLEGLGASAPVRGFGSSDCRSGCPAHLLYTGSSDPLAGVIRIYRALGLRPVPVVGLGGA